ncbi:bifunctional metallophosphatase/5'-nucleotidase [Roseicitreum antarcticum]|uniref:5'-nucleotidase n=1 Tax=Roseicitreum antarcticum TaxID=564137 RepID=A0A1H2R3Y7_9RHOB|nr:bifunctional UDP-sugar hydrolase/5'-nucleotidase [Roseicitreum antarcticum]SDW13604.1 5'-nucleotidase [Roseicitreum antarcticum]
MRLSLLASTAIAALSAGAAFADTTLHVLHINDFHSRIEPINAFNSTCSAEDDAAGECFGGTARLFTLINDLRDTLSAEGHPVVVLDAGDSSQGSLFYTTYGGQAEADFMERIGFDAMAVGNHEFDLGPEGLAVFLDTVSFPILSSNLDVSASNILADRVMPYTIIERGGLKIGIVSALATDTPETASPGPSVVFEDEVAALRRVVAELQEQDVAPIIALTHVGMNRDLDIAAQVPGLTAVVGGHSHTYMSASDPDRDAAYPTWVGAEDGGLVPVVQAYSYGKYVGHLILELDDAGQLIHASGDTIVVDGSITPNAEIVAEVDALAGPIEELKSQIVAESAGPIEGDRTVCRAQECQMGNLVADAMLARVADQGITIAIQNGGGLRASISEGQVTMGDVLSVLPFQNTLSTFQVTGDVIIDALENGASRLEDGAGRFAQVAGLKYTLTAANEPGNRISDVMVMQGGDWAPIEAETLYGVVSNDYVRQGGDGYSMFGTEAVNAYDFGPDLADVLAEYMIENAPYQPYLDGRITVN